MSDDIKRLRELATAATPGPWRILEQTLGKRRKRRILDRVRPLAQHTYALAQIGGDPLLSDESDALARYIAAASPDVVLGLLDRLERAEKDAARYRWLRDTNDAEVYWPSDKNASGMAAWKSHDDLDAAMDAAMKVGSGGSGA